jgi:hypothetical protein
MSAHSDPFEVLAIEETSDEFAALSRKPVTLAPAPTVPGAATARFHGFDLDGRPLVAGAPGVPHEILPARSTVPLCRSDIGAQVVLLFESGDPRQPIVVGVLQQAPESREAERTPAQAVTVQSDGERFVVDAEREIVLRCGQASITLTRAGKVIIKGAYVVSRSTGYNKIKGAAVDIN